MIIELVRVRVHVTQYVKGKPESEAEPKLEPQPGSNSKMISLSKWQ